MKYVQIPFNLDEIEEVGADLDTLDQPINATGRPKKASHPSAKKNKRVKKNATTHVAAHENGTFAADGTETSALNEIEDVEAHEKVGKNRSRKIKPMCADLPVFTRRYTVDKLTRHRLKNQLDADLDLTAWDSFGLHKKLMQAICHLGFTKPTPIQEDSLAASLRSSTAILGAAETGSGKTFAFALPILHKLLSDPSYKTDARLKGLIFTPTRELAVQIRDNIRKLLLFTDISILDIIGGIAHVKQDRLLKLARPDIVVATPGRFYELLTQRSPHLRDLSGLRYIVMDEADRLLSTNHFKEFTHILNLIKITDIRYNTEGQEFANILRLEESADTVPRVGFSKNEQRALKRRQDRYVQLQSERNQRREGRERVHAELRALADQEAQMNSEFEDPDEAHELQAFEEDQEARRLNREFKDHMAQLHKSSDPYKATSALDEWEAENYLKIATQPRQFFIYSATLSFETFKFFGKKGHATNDVTLGKTSSINTILKTLDIGDNHVFLNKTTEAQIVSRLEEFRLMTPTEDKDYYLFYLLLSRPGKTIIFVNSIDCLKHIMGVFAHLQVDILSLHAQMSQRTRLNSIEKFTSSPNFVLIATDVAARGLDIPMVDLVIHYQVARSTSLYIHRSGRAARGTRHGDSVLLVNAADYAKYKRIRTELNKPEEIPTYDYDYYHFKRVKPLVRLAKRIDTFVHHQRRDAADRSWLERAAEDAGIILEDSNSGSSDDDDSDRVHTAAQRSANELARLKAELTAGIAAYRAQLNTTYKKPLPAEIYSVPRPKKSNYSLDDSSDDSSDDDGDGESDD